MGAANVIPGVSGGTIAFITGIYETLIDSLRSFGPRALRLAVTLRFRDLWTHVNGNFLAPLFAGVAISIVSLARLLEHLFLQHPVLTWSFFFGLILASIYFVGISIQCWTAAVIAALTFGLTLAVTISLLHPASENSHPLYLLLCGVIAICSMIVPGLSGSFVLLLLGNYLLVLGAISGFASAALHADYPTLGATLTILLPFGTGCVAGLLAFSHLIGWIFRRHHDVAVAVMTGFVAGSLLTIWPWKDPIHLRDSTGELILKHSEPVIRGYTWSLPEPGDPHTWSAAAIALLGAALVVAVEKLGSGCGRSAAES